jgi:hypothetical protein
MAQHPFPGAEGAAIVYCRMNKLCIISTACLLYVEWWSCGVCSTVT